MLAVLAWMQNMYAAPIPIGFLYFAMLMALAAAIPVGLILFNWIGDPERRHGRGCGCRMLFALGAIVLIVIGLAGELSQSVVPVGWQLADTRRRLGRHPRRADRRRRPRRLRRRSTTGSRSSTGR